MYKVVYAAHDQLESSKSPVKMRMESNNLSDLAEAENSHNTLKQLKPDIEHFVATETISPQSQLFKFSEKVSTPSFQLANSIVL